MSLLSWALGVFTLSHLQKSVKNNAENISNDCDWKQLMLPGKNQVELNEKFYFAQFLPKTCEN